MGEPSRPVGNRSIWLRMLRAHPLRLAPFTNLSISACSDDESEAAPAFAELTELSWLSRSMMVWTMAHGRYPTTPTLASQPLPAQTVPPDQQGQEWAGMLDILRRAGMHRDVPMITDTLALFGQGTLSDPDKIRFLISLAQCANQLYLLLPIEQDDRAVWDVRLLHAYAGMCMTHAQLAMVHEAIDATVAVCAKDLESLRGILARWCHFDLVQLNGLCTLTTATLSLLLPDQTKLETRPAGADPSDTPTLIDWQDTSGDGRLGVNDLAVAHAVRLAMAFKAYDLDAVEKLLLSADNPLRMAYGAAYAAVHLIAQGTKGMGPYR